MRKIYTLNLYLFKNLEWQIDFLLTRFENHKNPSRAVSVSKPIDNHLVARVHSSEYFGVYILMSTFPGQLTLIYVSAKIVFSLRL